VLNVVRDRPLDERQVFMAMTHINRWLVVDGKKLTKLQIVTLRLAVTADIKKARPTVRRKPPVQQPQAKIARRLKRAVSDLRKGYISLVEYDLKRLAKQLSAMW
jgi:hypothetical protein